MKEILPIALCSVLILFLGTVAYAQHFTGTYKLETPTGDVVLRIDHLGSEKYSGSLAGNGMAYKLSGSAEEDYLTGTLGDYPEIWYFEAVLHGKDLTFTMANIDSYGNPVAATAQSLMFFRSEEAGPSSVTEPAAGQGEVVINDRVLTSVQIAAIKDRYGVVPKAGNYWYDGKSGLYGVVGYAAYGFMHPGHEFGPLKSDASKGDTRVFINGREINLKEYTIWSYMLGYWIQPGRFWLDHQGNAGYEGDPTIVVNLYNASQQNAYQGQGGSGDNFWSTKFSAGNYDQGNTRGYVSVPGYGPVGYGF